jgi:hypothetical protein
VKRGATEQNRLSPVQLSQQGLKFSATMPKAKTQSREVAKFLSRTEFHKENE